LRAVARQKGAKLLCADPDSSAVSAYVEGYIDGHKRGCAAGYNFYCTARDWLHHKTDFLKATIADLQYEFKFHGQMIDLDEIEIIERIAKQATDHDRKAVYTEQPPEELAEAHLAMLKKGGSKTWFIQTDYTHPDDTSPVIIGVFGNGPKAEFNAKLASLPPKAILAMTRELRALKKVQDVSKKMSEYIREMYGENGFSMATRINEDLFRALNDYDWAVHGDKEAGEGK